MSHRIARVVAIAAALALGDGASAFGNVRSAAISEVPPLVSGDRAVRARLVIAEPSPQAGRVRTATVVLIPLPGWHLYGPERGDAGRPPRIAWTLPRGMRAGPIVWPRSTRVRAHGLTTFEYHGRTSLAVSLVDARTMIALRSALVRADVSWVVCSSVCAPGHAVLTARTPAR